MDAMPWEDLCRIPLKKSIMASPPLLAHSFTHTHTTITGATTIAGTTTPRGCSVDSTDGTPATTAQDALGK